jgi:hypothetical protein
MDGWIKMVTKRKRKINIQKIEQKAIENIVGIDKAYRRHKDFCRKLGKNPKTKEQFTKDYMKQSETKISQIKAIIAKFNDKKAPIINKECFEFRKLFSRRQGYIDTEKFALDLTTQENNLFYNHIGRCDSCTFYASLHKFDEPAKIPEVKEATQKEFEQSINEFYETVKGSGDNLDDWENEKGFGDSTPDMAKAINGEYDRRQEQPEPE